MAAACSLVRSCGAILNASATGAGKPMLSGVAEVVAQIRNCAMANPPGRG